MELKPIFGFPDYFVSESGNIISRKYGKERELKPQTNRNGYRCVILMQDGKPKLMGIHRLVALAFIPNPESKAQVDHIDGNPQNNNSSNLRWMSCKENLHAAMQRHGKWWQAVLKPEHVKISALDMDGTWIDFSGLTEAVAWLNRNREDGDRLSPRAARSSVWKVCQGKQHYAYGHKWKFTDGPRTATKA